METLSFEFAAAQPAAGRALAGVVGSGDLEVLLEPHADGKTVVAVTTSVEGMGKTWEAVLTRLFSGATLPSVRIDIHDFGATPGVVRMRLDQAFEQLLAGTEAKR